MFMRMKANELMIGDWVLSKFTGTPCRVKLESFVCHDSWEDGNHGAFNFNDVEPIPLTKEMLVNDEFYIAEEASHNAVLKNKTGDALIVVRIIGSSFVLNIERNIEFEGTYAIDSVHKCGYFVHEYQHALRICGLNELADNFKVTD